MKKLCLVDVSAMYFRAFYAIRPLSNSAGLPTNALYGFLSMTSKMLRELQPDYIAYCFDRKDGSFRNELYSEYKANRSEMPEDLIPQVPYIRKIVDALQIPALELPGYEADDVIGMLASLGEDEGVETIIVSGDKDFAQLVNDRVCMYDPMKDVYYKPEGVFEKWQVKPEQIIDYLALVGDSSDNIPGVKGIGPKGAVKLLTEFGTLDGIYEAVDRLSAKSLREKLVAHKENAYMSQKLVSIVTENKTEVKKLEDLKWAGPSPQQIRVLMEELEFKNIGGKILADSAYIFGGEVPQEMQSSTKSLWNEEELSKYTQTEIPVGDFLKQLKETKGKVYFYLVGEKLCFVNEGSLEIFSCPAESIEGEEVGESCAQFKGHDIKSLWRSFGIHSASCDYDSMIAEYLILAKSIGSFATVVPNYLPNSSQLDLMNPVMYHLSFLAVEKAQTEKLNEYECSTVYREVELPIVAILYAMERAGILFNKGILEEQGRLIEQDTDRIRKEVHEICEADFNLDSPKQLGKVLFEDMKLPVIKKNKTGYSTNAEVLNKLKVKHPWVDKIIQYRELQKLLNTYIHALPDLVNPKDGRIHTHFNQAVAATGRLSSTEPNLQNIPIRTPQGNAIRKAFVAPSGKKILSADYSQIELRLLAHITQDPGLCRAFSEDRDIHSATAAEVFEVPFEQVDSEMRRRAKAINFGIAYGMGAFSLAENLGISRKDAKDIIDRYFQRFAGVKNYMSNIVEEAKEKTYVRSLLGRRRYVEELFSSNAMIRANGERIAINTPMQSSASDIVKKAMVDIAKDLPYGTMLLQVHDELIFEVEASKANDLAQWVKQKMESVISLDVPLKVNTNIGDNWQEAH